MVANATKESAPRFDAHADPQLGEAYASGYERWNAWPVSWTGVIVGALASLATIILIGLIGLAVGAHLLGPENRVVDLKKVGMTTLILSVAGAFFAFVLGGWVAARIAGIRRSEPAMLHGAVTFLTATPFILLFGALGAGSLMGGWYGGLAGSPSWAAAPAVPYERPDAINSTATPDERAKYDQDMREYRNHVNEWKENTPKVTRNSALGAATALLLGLIGAVVGGWLASGEPMNFSHYRTRKTIAMNRPT